MLLTMAAFYMESTFMVITASKKSEHKCTGAKKSEHKRLPLQAPVRREGVPRPCRNDVFLNKIKEDTVRKYSTVCTVVTVSTVS